MDQPVKSTHKEMFVEITNYCMNSVNKKQLMRSIILPNSAHTFFTYPRKHSSSTALLPASFQNGCMQHGNHKKGGAKKHLKDTKLKSPQNKEVKCCIKEFILEKTVLHHSLSSNPKLNVQRHLSIVSYAVKTELLQKLYTQIQSSLEISPNEHTELLKK